MTKETVMTRMHHVFSKKCLGMVTAVVFGLLALSCASPPPVDTVAYLIRVDRGNCIFHVLDVEEVGPYNEDAGYWPVKVRLQGACDAGFRTMKVDTTEEFFFFEEGKGYWRYRQ